MKAKRGKYRLSPNEEAQLVKDETERRRKQRIIQVRQQSKQNASKIRQAVNEEKNRQVQKLAAELQNQLEKEKEEKLRKLEAQYENSLKSIGQGHKEADEQYDRTEERELLQKEDNRRAEARGSAAMDKLRRDKMFREFEETKQIKARQAALEEERNRAARVAALPPPEPDPLLNLNVPSKKQVKMTDVDNFTTTHYHILQQYSIDKADPTTQEDARTAAEEEERRIREKSQELVRISNDRMTRARVRHNNALEKEILSHDYDKMLMDLSDLQRADRERRLHVVANIPKQVFEPPHRRIEDREEHQRDMETAFEDMYMAQTNYIGDLSLALDPHPPPETPSATESLEVSLMTEGTPVQEPTLPRVPPVLKDMTNIPRPAGEKSPVKKPEKVLRKLMDKIKSQRDEWISKSNADINIDDTTQERDVSRHTAVKEPDEVPSKLSASESTGDKGVDAVLQQQKEIENQKRALEEKLKALEAEHASVKQAAESKPYHQIQPQTGPHHINGYATTTEQRQLPSSYSWTVPANLSQSSLSSTSMTSQPPSTSLASQSLTQQYIPVKPTDKLNMQVPENYPVPVTLLPREPVVSSLPKHYVPFSQRQEETQSQIPAVSHGRDFLPPTYTSALSQIQNLHDGGSYGHMPASSQPQQQMHFNVPQTITSTYGVIPSQPQPQQYISSNGPSYSTGVFHPQYSYQQVRPVVSAGGHPLSVSSLSTSSGEYYPQTFPTPSLPVPSTVGMMQTSFAPVPDHTKKIKDYQQYLLQRHEQSKKVLADTRAEIEQRRQELVKKFPQLASKSPESSELSHDGQVTVTASEPVNQPISASLATQPAGEGTQQSPSKAAISSLVSQLASDPYYALRLGIGQSKENGKPETSQSNKKLKDVRKSLPFDESLQESPFSAVHDSGGRSRRKDFDSTMDTDDGRKELDDTVMSSSTDRGSPKLPMNGRKSGQTSESDMDTSGQSQGKDLNDIYDQRQTELKKQLEEIQKQKDAILQRHDMAHLRLHAEQERLKYQMKEEERQMGLVPETVTSEESTTEVDTDDERSRDVLTTKQLRGPPPKQRMNVLSEHRPHELSTIQEVDTPRSAPRSLESGKPSLSSSGSSVSRRSLDPYQLSTGTIPEEMEPAQGIYPTPTNRRTAGDTGYHTQQIEDILERAREFDPSVVERLKSQTKEIFGDISTPPQKGGTPGSNMSISMGSLTPDSLSTGPISDSNVSTQFNSPSDAPAFRVVNQKVKDSSRSDSSYPSGMSWADELSNYSGQYHSMKMDESSKTSVDTKLEPGFKVLSSSSQEKLDSDGGDERRPSKSPVDRKYDVFHMKPEQQIMRKSPVDIGRPKQFDESATSDGSSKLNLQDLSSYTMSEKSERQGSRELSQYPLFEKGQFDNSSSDDRSRVYTSSSAVNDSSTRESPLGGTDVDNGDDNKLLRTAESLGSTATSASSYMDLEAINGLNKPFDFIGQFKSSDREQTASTSGDLIELDSSKYSQQGGFTSTPYTTQDRISSQQVSGLSEYTLSPEESKIQSGSLPQHSYDISSKHTPAFITRSGDFGSSDSSAPNSGEKKVGATLSQYSLKSDTQGVTLIGKEMSQYSIESSSENVSPDNNAVKSLSQYSLEPSAFQNDSSLSQHSLDPTRQISGLGLNRQDKSMTQYDISMELTGETTKSSAQDQVDGHLSQYSIHSDEKSLTQGKLNESELRMDYSKLSSGLSEGYSISQHTIDSNNDENDGMVEKKFANLDNLIRESRDLIAKHKQLITKNKEWEQKSEGSTPEKKSPNFDDDNKNENAFESLNLKKSEIPVMKNSKPSPETSGSSFNVTDDVSPMMITASSTDMTHEHMRTGDSLSMESFMHKLPGDSVMSRLSQLDTTAGISDEPDLTLVTESSDVSMTQEGQLTQRSDGSQNDDSVLSFEKHEQSVMSSQNDLTDLPYDKDEDHSGLARQTLQESVERRQLSLSTVKRDAGEDVVFRAVPVLVSPTLSFSMNLNTADMKQKSPLTWASELSSEKEEKTTGNKGSTKIVQSYKYQQPKQEAKKESVSKKVEVPVNKSKSAGNLNPALQPRNSGSIPPSSGAGQKSSSVGQAKSAGIISLGDFLKRQISKEEEGAKSEPYTQNKGSAIVTTKNKPSPNINSKPASPSKSTSFYGKAKESNKTPSFSIGKKTTTATGQSSKPGIYSSGKSQGGKLAANSHMSKTLSSWKKSRAVKSSSAPPPPKPSAEFPNGVKEFPKPVARSEEDEAYERHMRLQNRLGIEEPEDTQEEKKKSPKTRETLEEKQKRAESNRDKVKEFQKKLQETMKKKQMQKKQVP